MAHQDLVRAAAKLSTGEAARRFLSGYLRGAVGATGKKLFSMFNAFLSRTELEEAIDALVRKKKVSMEKIGSENRVFVHIDAKDFSKQGRQILAVPVRIPSGTAVARGNIQVAVGAELEYPFALCV